MAVDRLIYSAREHLAGARREWVWVAFLLVVLLPAQAWFAITRATQGMEHVHVHGSGGHQHAHHAAERHFHEAGVPMVAVDAGDVRLQASLESAERSREGSMLALMLISAHPRWNFAATALRPQFDVPSRVPAWLFPYRLDRPPRTVPTIRDHA
jgi:hypothetical protein